MNTVDARGQKCPMPLILTRRVIKLMVAGELLEVLVDSETARNNIRTYLQEQMCEPVVETLPDGGWRLAATLSASFDPLKRAEDYCSVGTPATAAAGAPAPAPRTGPVVVSLRGDLMGQGDDLLGAKLIGTFLIGLAEQEPLPTHVVLYNGGARLAIRGTSTGDSLVKLEQAGVNIAICGTCVDFFGLREQLACGKISNMYDITALLLAAAKVISP
jgi:selenium metabolism protein YedF